jgi:hypothetical protein
VSLYSDYAETVTNERAIGRNREACISYLESLNERKVASSEVLPSLIQLNGPRILFLYASSWNAEFTDKRVSKLFRFDSACYRLICRT